MGEIQKEVLIMQNETLIFVEVIVAIAIAAILNYFLEKISQKKHLKRTVGIFILALFLIHFFLSDFLSSILSFFSF